MKLRFIKKFIQNYLERSFFFTNLTFYFVKNIKLYLEQNINHDSLIVRCARVFKLFYLKYYIRYRKS